MESDKNIRQVGMLCPTCGSHRFAFDKGTDDEVQSVTCASCGRQIPKDDLIWENMHRISDDAVEMGQDIARDAVAEAREKLKRSFKKNKNVKLK